MTDPIVPPVDIETPASAPAVEDNDDELEPEVLPPPPNETAEQKDARIAELEERNSKLWARVQRNKAKPAPVAPATPAPKPVAETTPGLSRDEAILIAKGLSEDEVEYAKKVAALQGVKPTEAINDDLFTTWKEKKDKDAKARSAQLPASRGSRSTVKKSFNTPGLSADDHKALFKEKMGQ